MCMSLPMYSAIFWFGSVSVNDIGDPICWLVSHIVLPLLKLYRIEALVCSSWFWVHLHLLRVHLDMEFWEMCFERRSDECSLMSDWCCWLKVVLPLPCHVFCSSIAWFYGDFCLSLSLYHLFATVMFHLWCDQTLSDNTIRGFLWASSLCLSLWMFVWLHLSV